MLKFNTIFHDKSVIDKKRLENIKYDQRMINDIKLNIVEALGIIKNPLNKNEIKSLYEKIFSCSELLEEGFTILERYKSLAPIKESLDSLCIGLYSYVKEEKPINSQEEFEQIKARGNDIRQKFDSFFEDFNSVINDSKSKSSISTNSTM